MGLFADIKIYQPKGYSSFATSCGIKDETLDLGIIISDVASNAVAVFTQNQFPGEPVKIGKEHVRKGQIRAVVVNSKNANVGTGKQGYANSMKICKTLAKQINCEVEKIFPSSTGVIARQLPVDKVTFAIGEMASSIKSPANFEEFAKAIMTTDTVPKLASAKVGEASIVAVAKGSGMIEPNMATMLSYIFTDAKINREELGYIFRRCVNKTFNCLSIDTDTSTSDTALIMANGLAGEVNLVEFENSLLDCMELLTRKLARDGEGATKLFIVDVENAHNEEQAQTVAKLIINSPLVKTSIYQGDPNWGRIIMATGKNENIKIDPNNLEILWGEPAKKYSNDELDSLQEYLRQNEQINLTVKLNVGEARSRAYGCDLTEEYVKINAYYTT